MAYNLLGTRSTYYVSTNSITPDVWDIRGYGKAYYDQTASDLVNNQSRVKLEYGVEIIGTWYGQYKVTGTIYQKISGNWVSVSSTTYQSSLGTLSPGTYLRGTLTDVIIPHDSDGNAQFRVGVIITGQSGVTGSRSYVYIYDLPTIEEQASIESVTVAETNTTLTGYGIGANTYVNLLSKKQYTISVYNPNSAAINTYEVINGTLTNKKNYSTSSTNVVSLDFNDKEIYTENISNEERPSIIAKVNFSSGGSVYSYVNYTTNTFINYNYPQFIPTATTTKRNGQLSGKVTLNASGTYYNGSIGSLNQGGSYKPTVKYKIWRTDASEPSTYAYTIPASSITISNGTFSVSSYEIGSDNPSASNYFDFNYSYNVKLQVSDTFKSNEYTANVTQGIAVWTEYKDRVDFRKVTITDISTGTTKTQVDTNGLVTNKITAGNIQSGRVILNSSTDVTVTFDTPFADEPDVVITPYTTTNGVIAPKINSITTTSFTAFIGGSGFSNIECSWIAIDS